MLSVLRGSVVDFVDGDGEGEHVGDVEVQGFDEGVKAFDDPERDEDDPWLFVDGCEGECEQLFVGEDIRTADVDLLMTGIGCINADFSHILAVDRS